MEFALTVGCSRRHFLDDERLGKHPGGPAAGFPNDQVTIHLRPRRMRKACLLYNPVSGGRRSRRQAELKAALSVLQAAGVEAELVAIRSPQDAAQQARQAIAQGCDTVFACGGDGTIHDILQGLAGTSAALAVLPMGTANALAHDLGMPLNPVGAARAALHSIRRRIALGRIAFLDAHGKPGTHYFTVAAGVGVDAHLFYKLSAAAKGRLGMAAYYVKAWHLWIHYRMRRFQAQYAQTGTGGPGAPATESANVTELLAVRIRNFGGVLRELAPGASLERNDLRLVLCRTASRTAYLRYVLRGLFGRRRTTAGIELVHSEKVSCQYLPAQPRSDGTLATDSPIHVEADGEFLGTLPAEITVVPDALTLLVPTNSATTGVG
jgi:diacylglycerol kinase (ATP)